MPDVPMWVELNFPSLCIGHLGGLPEKTLWVLGRKAKTSSCRKQHGHWGESSASSNRGNFEVRLPFACAEPEHSHLQAKRRFSNAPMSFGGKRGLLPNQHKCRLRACELAQSVKVLATKPEDLSFIPRTLMVVGEN